MAVQIDSHGFAGADATGPGRPNKSGNAFNGMDLIAPSNFRRVNSCNKQITEDAEFSNDTFFFNTSNWKLILVGATLVILGGFNFFLFVKTSQIESRLHQLEQMAIVSDVMSFYASSKREQHTVAFFF